MPIVDMGKKLELVYPQCGRCGKPVETIGSTPIADPNDLRSILGQRLTYSCHGESQSFDVAAWWFEDPNNAGLPFVPKVFGPTAPLPEENSDDLETIDAIAQALPPGQEIRISITNGNVEIELYRGEESVGFERKTIGYMSLHAKALGVAKDIVRTLKRAMK